MWLKIKYYVYAIALLTYSIGVWTVSAGYSENSFNKERLEQSKAIVRLMDQNATTGAEIAKKLEAQLEAGRRLGRLESKEIYEAVLSDPRYKSCRVTDGVRNALQRKLDRQDSGEPVKAVPKGKPASS